MLKNYKNIRLLILAEGITEKILLPEFAKVAGIDFIQRGIKVISSGGKNRLLSLYNKINKETEIPILMLFDADAEGLIYSNRHLFRGIDDYYVISKGEFEDILPDKLIYKALNDHFQYHGKIDFSEISDKFPKTQLLTEIYRLKGFGSFKKAEFAKIISDNITGEADLSEELKQIFLKIRSQPARI